MVCAAPVVIRRGLPLRLRHDAARLIWAGFGGQIAPGLGRRAGTARIRRGLQRGRVIVALDGSGALVGLTGLRGSQGGVVEVARPRPSRAQRVAQRVVALMARPLVGTTEDLVLDCLIVAPRWRGCGVAAALIHAALAEAARQGHPGLGAEVARGNTSALRAYGRAGLSGPRGWRPGPRTLRRAVARGG